MTPIGIVVIDDSALTRSLLAEMIRREPDMNLLGMARDGIEGLEICRRLKPDVVTADIEMPRMDGIEFLSRIREVHRCQVLMISSLTRRGAEQTFKALSLGAFDYVAKPLRAAERSFEDYANEIIEKIRYAALRSPPPVRTTREPAGDAGPAGAPASATVTATIVRSSGAGLSDSSREPDLEHPMAIIAIGASTGGPQALHEVLKLVRPQTPPVVVAMHMPVPFTGLYASRLSSQYNIPLREAEHREPLLRGRAYLIPGNQHAGIARGPSGYQIRLRSDDGGYPYRPSVDALFLSVAEVAGEHAIAVVLTGMGNDGLKGSRAIRGRGGYIICQDEASSLIYGMPKAVSSENLADMSANPAGIVARLTARTAIRQSVQEPPC